MSIISGINPALRHKSLGLDARLVQFQKSQLYVNSGTLYPNNLINFTTNTVSRAESPA